MDLANLKDRLVEWLRGGPEGDVVVSSRVRLARNLKGHRFVARASDEEREGIEKVLRAALLSPDGPAPLNYVELTGVSPLLRDMLLERRLISQLHADGDWVRGVAFDDKERLSVLVNEEDHVRIQSIRGGLRIEEAYEEADRFDDHLSEKVEFAYSADYGYLSACPTNAGTGLRASMMLHLPALAMAQRIEQVLQLSEEQGFVLRGGYGEGTHGAGDFYQISNQVALGKCEEDITLGVVSSGRQIIAMERQARQQLYRDSPREFRRHAERALELLCSAQTLSSQEALSFLSQVRMGVQMQVIEGAPAGGLDDLFLLTLPAHLQTIEGGPLDSAVRNELRAVFVRSKLSAT
jgi:protein arginine kinase